MSSLTTAPRKRNPVPGVPDVVTAVVMVMAFFATAWAAEQTVTVS